MQNRSRLAVRLLYIVYRLLQLHDSCIETCSRALLLYSVSLCCHAVKSGMFCTALTKRLVLCREYMHTHILLDMYCARTEKQCKTLLYGKWLGVRRALISSSWQDVCFRDCFFFVPSFGTILRGACFCCSLVRKRFSVMGDGLLCLRAYYSYQITDWGVLQQLLLVHVTCCCNNL